MEFYQKLQKLRRENGMSQEDLANHLNVSRQAVSKWENGQGYPETDKLLQISGLYGVSVDYLLKDEAAGLAESEVDDDTFYASREMVNGYLVSSWQLAKQIALGVGLILLALVWLFILPEGLAMVLFFIQMAAGVGVLVASGFRAKRYDERIEKQPLVFDAAFIKEFRQGYQGVRRRAGGLIVGGIMSILLGIAAVIGFSGLMAREEEWLGAILFVFLAAGVACIILGGCLLSAHGLIAENHKHIEELKAPNTGWIYGVVMTLATAVFLFMTFSDRTGMRASAGLPDWAVFPIAALLAVVISEVYKNLRSSK